MALYSFYLPSGNVQHDRQFYDHSYALPREEESRGNKMAYRCSKPFRGASRSLISEFGFRVKVARVIFFKHFRFIPIAWGWRIDAMADHASFDPAKHVFFLLGDGWSDQLSVPTS